MARNAPKSGSQRQSSRVTKAPVQRQAAPTRSQQRQARKRMWLQIMCAFLVLAMLLPVIISFL